LHVFFIVSAFIKPNFDILRRASDDLMW